MGVRVHFNPILANKKQGGILFLKGRKGVSMVELVSYIYLFMIKIANLHTHIVQSSVWRMSDEWIVRSFCQEHKSDQGNYS